MKRSRRWWLGIVGASCVLLACGEMMNGPPISTGEDAIVEGGSSLLSVAGIPVSNERMQWLLRQTTRSVARALGNPEVREKVYIALASSPYREHKLHLGTILRGDVKELLSEMATAELTNEATILTILDSIVDLEFYMPVTAHRAAWTGADELIVASQLLDDGTTPIAFDLKGEEVFIQSAIEPPDVPTLALVPVETDFNGVKRSSPQVGQPPASPASETAGIYLTYTHILDLNESWIRGSPEIEVHAYRRFDADSFYDFSCAGESNDEEGDRYFDQDSNYWTGRVLVASEAQIKDTSAYDEEVFLQIWEDDDDPCVFGAHPAFDGMPPNVNNQAARDSIESITNQIVGIWWSALNPDSLVAKLFGIGKAIMFVLTEDHDVMVGFAKLAGTEPGCWAESSGPETFELYGRRTGYTGYTNNGYGYFDFAYDHTRAPMCALDATISGPGQIVISNGSYSPIPTYTAVITGGGAGPTSYAWMDGGDTVSTSSSYTISPVVASTHYITLTVTRGSATDTSPTKTVTIIESGGGEEAPAYKRSG